MGVRVLVHCAIRAGVCLDCDDVLGHAPPPKDERAGTSVLVQRRATMKMHYEKRDGYDVPVLVCPSSDVKRGYWGKKAYRRKKVHRSGDCPQFRTGGFF